MFPAFRIGRLFGIDIDVRASFLALLAFVALFMGGWMGVFAVLLAFASVVAHEYGHALVARHLGVDVRHIELHFFGGVARLESQPRSANDEIVIAIAGPIVSAVLATVAYGLYGLTGFAIFLALGTINTVIALFNMLPAFPMDGGRVFRAWMSKRIGMRAATHKAVQVSRYVSVAMGFVGLVSGAIQLVLLAFVLWMMGSAEKRALDFAFGGGYQGGWGGSANRSDRGSKRDPHPSSSHRGHHPRQRVVVVRYE